ncbi:hypothetical protein MMYC01_205944 [Madurella mycetomatis]|uniref:Uncharacterized protein n=1 Tax=Madurella mycetomatis TaxID=100816 RepID=A0A175W2C0_9PEZI|nr:hypothetical protein MMYC01_205944 [Madurella mycetomatis]
MIANLKTVLPFLLAPLTLAAPQPENLNHAPRQAAGEIVPTSIISHDLAWQVPNMCLSPGTRPSAYRRIQAGNECWLELTTTPPTTLVPNPGAQLDVFRMWGPGSCEGGATGNNRDVQLGRLNVPGSGAASWGAVYNAHLTGRVPCPAAGTTENIEIVAVGEPGEVTFPQEAGAGLRIRYA